MRSVPFPWVSQIAEEFGAVEVFARESDRSFTGFVAEIWFDALPKEFCTKWAAVVGYAIAVRAVEAGPGRFCASVPVTVPEGEVRLKGGTRGGRVRCQLVR